MVYQCSWSFSGEMGMESWGLLARRQLDIVLLSGFLNSRASSVEGLALGCSFSL